MGSDERVTSQSTSGVSGVSAPRLLTSRTRLSSVTRLMWWAAATSITVPAGRPSNPAQSRTDWARLGRLSPNTRHVRFAATADPVPPRTGVPGRQLVSNAFALSLPSGLGKARVGATPVHPGQQCVRVSLIAAYDDDPLAGGQTIGHER